ncbi:MAG: hypothetical protein FJ294_11215 [Planctomycetes bacterium]|nr:hypothetical protein [Planctomycetota bacterium]
MKFLARTLALLLALAALLPLARATQSDEDAHSGTHGTPHGPLQRSAPWPAETLELAASLPIQDGGRIKPLSTYASFMLLRLNGKRAVELPGGAKLTPIEWLLDMLFVPGQAEGYPVFMVSDIQAVEAIGISVADKKKRDRYSAAELRKGRSKLYELAREYERIEEKNRSTVQQQVFSLALNFDAYERLETSFDFARHDLDVSGSTGLRKIFGADSVRFSQLVGRVPEVMALQRGLRSDAGSSGDLQALNAVLQEASAVSQGTGILALVPSLGSVKAEPEWHAAEDLFLRAFEPTGVDARYIAALARLEDVARSASDMPRFSKAVSELHGSVTPMAAARGEYEKIGLEISYYKANLITNSLVLFILGFLLAAGLWLAPRVKALYVGANLAVFAATALLTGAIVMRCMIRERPPVSTLYETLLFVTATGALIALAMEWINRQRMALSSAAILGVVGLFIANGYETLDKKDTMPQLVAVLDTNFWLATHVTAITIGYSAGMLAALIASVYLVSKVLGLKRADPQYFRSLTRMTYGTLCFGLIFSVVGTILGGIWANESWGRFWGWDPKENGALLICLAQIVVLHARMGGYVRDFGIQMLAAFGGTVVAFSWFGVNLLGVGLHSYGFTSGIHTALWTYYGIQWGLMAVAGAHHLYERGRDAAVQEALRASSQAGKAKPS